MRAHKLLMMGFLGGLIFFRAGWAQPFKEIPSAMTRTEVDSYASGRAVWERFPAETFGYPSPEGVLALQKPLDLTADQKENLQAVLEKMRQQVQFFGRKIVMDELFLDNLFRQGETSLDALYNILERIGGWRMRLRVACLNAYLNTRKILTADQLKKYQELRASAPVPHEVSTK